MSGEMRTGNRPAPTFAPSDAEKDAQRSDAPCQTEDRGRRDDVLRRCELAARLKISMRCLDSWSARGWVTGIKRGRVRRFVWGEVLEQLRKGKY